MTYSLGVDIGSVNIKTALIDDNCNVVFLDSEKIASGPKAAINSLLIKISKKFNHEQITSAGASCSGKTIIPKELNWAENSSSLSISAGLIHFHPDAKTIIQIGGQSSIVIALEDGLKKPWKTFSNPLCAAGTGRFMEQQAYRLGISMEDFATMALKCQESPPRIAARCSVFAKTDLIHLQQKGVAVENMLYALCESISRMVSSLNKGAFEPPVYFLGGVASNKAVVKALGEVLSTKNSHPLQVIVPENHLYIEAIGSALLSRGKRAQSILIPESDRLQKYFEMPKLEVITEKNDDFDKLIEKPCTGYLGVDVGSTSTKAVIVDDKGNVIAKHYLMTAGRPVNAVKEVFTGLLKKGAGKTEIAGAGVTGSGRYLIGSLIGADLIKNEITAQTRAAEDIDSEADIIEIGGQDSKLVLKKNNIVFDYQMNKACAAGTGSFIDELAEMLNISVRNGEFAKLAFEAPYTIDLGTRCAAFMGQAVSLAQQEGIPLSVITASLANSIAKNYLSKVVGNRKLGNKVILTGAVFYNQAVISAFRQQLKGKTFTVAEHKEVTGAIGAALLAKEDLSGRKSNFKGLQEVVDGECNLSSFTCKACDNNCTITRLETNKEKPTFYGSRCERYESAANQKKTTTFFDEREKLLFREYVENNGAGPKVGIPRSLLVYDYAPLLLGFLNKLGARVNFSGKTTKEIVEKSTQLSYTDSCFPLKLLHGHTASLLDNDYILYPCIVRLGEKEGEENQKYACPLVQASPFIVNQVLELKEKLLAPIFDFSHGDSAVINTLANTAIKMGFNKKAGIQAALAGIKAQQQFELDKTALGERLIKQLHQNKQLGVVIFARSYMSQDAGANLSIAEKLAQLGVVPIPLDFLPLSTVSANRYSDRPYWLYESKQIAGAVITKADPQLYGLILTNFGCGPNSFILRLVEDIMGDKPLGQLEIDEHAAEAGIVTRLEAFVDTISNFDSTRNSEVPLTNIYRGTSALINSQKTLLIPKMAPHCEVISASMEAYGVRTIVLPEPDERNLLYSEKVTSGTECLPYRITLGDFIRFHHEHGPDTRNFEGFAAGSYGPCRLGKYSIEQIKILKNMGFDLPIRTTVSNNAYRDLNLGPGFERIAWRGIVAVDCLEKLVWRTRPYEKIIGASELLFAEYVSKIAERIRLKETFHSVLKQATAEFKKLIDIDQPRKPLIGINGEIYLRSNKFSNRNLVKVCEDAGLEAVVSPLGEWFKYTSFRNFEDASIDQNFKKIVISGIKKHIQEHDEHSISMDCRGILDTEEPSTAELLRLTSLYLSPKCGSEAVLSIGCGINWLENPRFAGVISVMPHGCMPGGIVAAMAEKFSSLYHKPWISLTYDGFMETNNQSKINSFAEVIKYCSKEVTGAAR